jgi:hypothetical protein
VTIYRLIGQGVLKCPVAAALARLTRRSHIEDVARALAFNPSYE